MSVPLLFGVEFSGALCLGCASLSVPPEWVLAVLCLEGNGMDPHAANASGARGMWQRMPEPVLVGGRPLILDLVAPCPVGCVLRVAHDLHDPTKVVGHSVWKLYAPTDPVRQLNDYFAWTRVELRNVNAGAIRSREALYCCNLAPERLRNGGYDPDTVLYPAPTDAYRANARSFGLDPNDPKGALRMSDLATGLDAAVKRHQAKFDAELEAANVANAGGPLNAA